MLQLAKPLAVIDIECTGMNLSTDRIIEIAIVKIMPDGKRMVKRKLLNPEMPIPPSQTEIHGITDEMVKDAPTFRQAANEIRQFIDNADLAGYNSNRFDVPMLVEEFLRISLELDFRNRKLIDVQKIFHTMEQRTLSAAYKFYCNATLENAHSAEADANATWEVLQSQVQRYPQLGITVDSILKCIGEETNMVDFARRMVMENGREVFNFGKHKGRVVTDVLKAEPQYYDWMMKGEFPLHTKQKLTEVFNRMMLKKG
ncbi:MAG: 3'-5' exonuclease [Chitinophagaceae bacterium]|nr:3'-5' exonuclease [Chitinophagaceae bacterium]